MRDDLKEWLSQNMIDGYVLVFHTVPGVGIVGSFVEQENIELPSHGWVVHGNAPKPVNEWTDDELRSWLSAHGADDEG